MKRSPGSPINGGPAKRFEAMRSSPQMQLQQQFHQQMAANQPYFSSMTTPPPGIPIMPYSNSSQQQPNLYHYNAAVGLTPHMWSYQMPPTPANTPLSFDTVQPPLPLGPPQQHPPLPPIETLQNNFSPSRSAMAPLRKNKRLKAAPSVEYDEKPTKINKKGKRKSMSNRYGLAKEWDLEDAVKALALEREFSQRVKCEILHLRFPDPELNRSIVSGYSAQIESVHFQQNASPRYCFVHLKQGADAAEVIETISKVPFASGFIKAELKHSQFVEPPHVNPEEIDPYTLYIGNLPTSISTRTVKEHFPGAHRIDIGFAQRMKFTRYAFVRYNTIEESLNAFRNSVNTLIDSRSLIVRFRRQHGNVSYAEQTPRKEHSLAPTTITAEAVTEAQNDTNSNTAIEEQNAKEKEENQDIPSISNNNHLDLSLSGTAFDSPASLEEPEQVQVESKLNVFRDAESLRQRISRSPRMQENEDNVEGSNLQSSLEEMFEKLESRQLLLAPGKPSASAQVKEELHDDDLSENEEVPNLLGARLQNEESQIKTEPDSSPRNDANKRNDEDFDYDNEFDMEPEEHDDDWPDPTTMHSNKATVSSNNPAQNSNWEAIRKNELVVVETKANVNITHATDVEKLYEQRRKFLKSNSGRKPRDNLDDMFAQMYSDEEDDDFLDF